MRIQFSVSQTERNKLQALAQKAGYPDISSYCKDAALEVRTFGTLWQTVVDKISKMEKGTVFALRDLVTTPPANLGVKLFQQQNALGIRVQEKDHLNSNTFIKL